MSVVHSSTLFNGIEVGIVISTSQSAVHSEGSGFSPELQMMGQLSVPGEQSRISPETALHASPDPDRGEVTLYTSVQVVEHSDQSPTQSMSLIHSTLFVSTPLLHEGCVPFKVYPSLHASSQVEPWSISEVHPDRDPFKGAEIPRQLKGQ